MSPLAYALIGCLFETQTRLSQTLQTAEQLGNTVAVALLPVHAELRTNPTWAPLYQRFDDLVLRGEHEVARWVVLGQQEHRHSQLLLKNALRISAETSIQQVVQNPEIQDLVQQQSVGLASEMVEEVREHAVSTDTFLERFVRHVLKRPQREDLPPPPVEVRLSAARLKTSEG
ncbi:MAG: hypothetical protein HC837_02205 [Chloroflexaceae bacterium]|nr:hypothetical protein [Chloroflexaceae bacterium]